MAKKIVLQEEDIPKNYYNIIADLPFEPHPPLDPETREPMGPEKMSVIFPMNLLEQEMSGDREIPIPEPVLNAYINYRPSPLVRATELEAALDTPARIYFKYEGVSPVGSHKPNTAIPQAYYNSLAGTKRLTTETGAGQWGSALAYACNMFDMECLVYMVRVSFDQKPYRKIVMKTYGADVYPSPSDRTETGRAILEKDPDTPGSLGMAISEAVEEAVKDKDTKYSLGSVLNHVLLHQSIVGQEAKKQMDIAGVYPDIIIGCHGGGSNFAGLAFPFARDKINGKDLDLVAVEPVSCPTLTKGEYDYDFGDSAGMTPLMKMYTLGHDFVPPSIHAGGLRYHGAAPLVSLLVREGLIRAESLSQIDIFDGAVLFARTEGIIPAPESAHAIQMAIVEAQKAKEEGKEKTILFNLSGHGLLDLSAFEEYFAGNLQREKGV